MTATHPIVDAYAAAINARDLHGVITLFADGAVLQHPLGTFTGPDEIGGFYRDVVIAGQAVVSAGAVVADGPLVMAEVTATSPLDPAAGSAHAIDVFRLGTDGRIRTLDIYYR